MWLMATDNHFIYLTVQCLSLNGCSLEDFNSQYIINRSSLLIPSQIGIPVCFYQRLFQVLVNTLSIKQTNLCVFFVHILYQSIQTERHLATVVSDARKADQLIRLNWFFHLSSGPTKRFTSIGYERLMESNYSMMLWSNRTQFIVDLSLLRLQFLPVSRIIQGFNFRLGQISLVPESENLSYHSPTIIQPPRGIFPHLSTIAVIGSYCQNVRPCSLGHAVGLFLILDTMQKRQGFVLFP